jgi:hypothetical protein
MHFTLEAVIVGMYTSCVYALCSPIPDPYILFFVIGFIKHFAGYYLGIHKYYCRNVCNKNDAVNTNLLRDSVIEGIVFMVIGVMLERYIKNEFLLFLILGFIMHILAEHFNIHKLFCAHRCV